MLAHKDTLKCFTRCFSSCPNASSQRWAGARITHLQHIKTRLCPGSLCFHTGFFLWGVSKPVGIIFNDCLLRLICHLNQRDLCNLWAWHFFFCLCFWLFVSCLKSIYQPNAFSITHRLDGDNYMEANGAFASPNVSRSPCLKVAKRTKIMGHNQADKAKTTSTDTKWFTSVQSRFFSWKDLRSFSGFEQTSESRREPSVVGDPRGDSWMQGDSQDSFCIAASILWRSDIGL